jgi:hypothetical protein
MAVYLITYDLNRETTRPPIVDRIKAYGDWAMLSESSYAISTNQTAEQVYANLQALLDQNDQIYIITLKKPWYGYGPKQVNEWLDNVLTY